jgi:hypothetical protein
LWLPGTGTDLHHVRTDLLHARAATIRRSLLPETLLARTAAPRSAIARLFASLQLGLQLDQLQFVVQQLLGRLCHQASLRFVLHEEPGSLLCVLQTEVRFRLWLQRGLLHTRGLLRQRAGSHAHASADAAG